MTLTGLNLDTNRQGGSKNITISSNTFTGQAQIDVTNNSNANIQIDGNTFDGISVCSNCAEGRLQISSYPLTRAPSGVTVTNNHFGGAAATCCCRPASS